GRNGVPPVRCENAQERNVWRILYSSGGRQAGGAHRVRRGVKERGGACTPPGASPSMVRPILSGASLMNQDRGRITTSMTRPMILAVVCQLQAAIARATPPTSTAGTKESTA